MDERAAPAPAGYAVAGLIFGCLTLVGWLLVPVGLPLALLGLYFSIRGLKSAKRKLAKVAVILSALGLFLTVSSFGIAYYVHVTGKPAVLRAWMDQVNKEAHRPHAPVHKQK